MNTPHIEIKQDGIITQVFINGEKIPGIRKVSFEREAGAVVPILKIDLMATDLSIDAVQVPELPDVFKPFYERKDIHED